MFPPVISKEGAANSHKKTPDPKIGEADG